MAVIGIAGLITAGTGLIGAMSSGGGSGQQQTQSKEPWAEAAPWLKKQIEQGQSLQQRYAENPFNPQQQTAYQNTFEDLNNFRSNTAPGLMNFANNMMTGPGYQRQQLQRPGQGGYGQRPPMQNQGQGGLMQGPFSMPQGGLMSNQYAPPDFAAQKPMQSMAPQQAAPAQNTMDDIMRMLEERNYYQNSGGGGS